MAAVRGISFTKFSSMLNACLTVVSKRGYSNSTTWSGIHQQLASQSNLNRVGFQMRIGNMGVQRGHASKSKPKVFSTDDSKFSQKPIIHVSATYNNTMLTLTDYKGNTIAWTSAKATDVGVSNVRVKVKGVGNGRQSSIRALQSGGLKVVSITDVTPIPHNGCRPKKARRI